MNIKDDLIPIEAENISPDEKIRALSNNDDFLDALYPKASYFEYIINHFLFPKIKKIDDTGPV